MVSASRAKFFSRYSQERVQSAIRAISAGSVGSSNSRLRSNCSWKCGALNSSLWSSTRRGTGLSVMRTPSYVIDGEGEEGAASPGRLLSPRSGRGRFATADCRTGPPGHFRRSRFDGTRPALGRRLSQPGGSAPPAAREPIRKRFPSHRITRSVTPAAVGTITAALAPTAGACFESQLSGSPRPGGPWPRSRPHRYNSSGIGVTRGLARNRLNAAP